MSFANCGRSARTPETFSRKILGGRLQRLKLMR
jgi:hypothetical protein